MYKILILKNSPELLEVWVSQMGCSNIYQRENWGFFSFSIENHRTKHILPLAALCAMANTLRYCSGVVL